METLNYIQALMGAYALDLSSIDTENEAEYNERAKDAEKAVSKVAAGGSKTKYFTDNLSKLDRSKRKLVQQIMAIIRRIVSKEVADQIQEAIEKEF